MKKNAVKRLLAIGLSCVLGMGMLAGCGSKELIENQYGIGCSSRINCVYNQ